MLDERDALKVLHKEVLEARQSLERDMIRGMTDHVKYREHVARHSTLSHVLIRIEELHKNLQGDQK